MFPFKAAVPEGGGCQLLWEHVPLVAAAPLKQLTAVLQTMPLGLSQRGLSGPEHSLPRGAGSPASVGDCWEWCPGPEASRRLS